MQVILRKRFGNYWFGVNELIQPHGYMVQEMARRLGPMTVHAYWNWVITHVQYPYGHIAWDDQHREQAFWRPTWFGRAPLFTYHQADYWAFPGEVLRDGVGDCKDTAALLTSFLRRSLKPNQVYMSVGWYNDGHQRHLHAWTTVFLPNGTPLALDTTYPRPLGRHEWVTEAPHYVPFWRANDARTVLINPHAAHQAYGHNIRIIASAPPRTARYATAKEA